MLAALLVVAPSLLGGLEPTCGEVEASFQQQNCCGTPNEPFKDNAVYLANLPRRPRPATLPPEDLIQAGDRDAISAWFDANLPSSFPPPDATARENEMAEWGVADYISQRRAGGVTCEEYTRRAVKWAEHYRALNHFTQWESNWTQMAIDRAIELDDVALSNGVEAIAPLYGLPVAIKDQYDVAGLVTSQGTVAFSGRPPSANNDVFVQRIVDLHGIAFGHTSMTSPLGLGTSGVTRLDGACMSHRNPKTSCAGSSGGSAAAVAASITPRAVRIL